ncbi:helix-turn-helix domain-containing protein [Roseomonas sp. CCTCC AB2023176]|uniref:helix-turn-helix domain-containing protein n=1 Tax=Roseomonas sp. CCTCC AB2023176 TaxID=3342640 RepID=UPI0035DF2018
MPSVARDWTPEEFVTTVGDAIGSAPERRSHGALGPVEACRWLHPAAHETPVAAMDAHFVAVTLGAPVNVACRIEGERERSAVLRPGGVTVVPAGRRVDWRIGGPMTVLNLFLPGPWARGLRSEGGPDGKRLRPMLGGADPHVERLGLLVLDLIQAPEPDPVYGEALAVALLARLSSGRAAGTAAPAGLSRTALRRSLDHMQAHLEEPLTLADLAAAAGLSPFHFARGFRSATGQPPHRALIGLRIARAKALLADPRAPVAEVAMRAGFAGPTSLAHAFRREVGMTPTAYRAACGVPRAGYG